VTNVKNVIIWGNHSSTQYPDVNHGTADGKPIRQVLQGDDEWLDNEFVETVQQRGAAVIKVGVVVLLLNSLCCCCCCHLPCQPPAVPATNRCIQAAHPPMLTTLCCSAALPQARVLSSAMRSATHDTNSYICDAQPPLSCTCIVLLLYRRLVGCHLPCQPPYITPLLMCEGQSQYALCCTAVLPYCCTAGWRAVICHVSRRTLHKCMYASGIHFCVHCTAVLLYRRLMGCHQPCQPPYTTPA
jgi:hypothetical protein